MTSTTKDAGLTTIPPLKVEQSEKTEKIADRPSGIPVPSRPTNGLKEKTTTSRHKHSIGHRFLSPAEWARVAHGLGAVHDGESHTVVHPTSFYWPPKGLPDGLYRDVIYQKTKYAYKHQVLSNIRWALMILQIIIGAVLTSLGSLDLKDGTPITIFAAVNTVGAGLLALMHNSGLPDRYRLDKVEYSKVADFIKELLDTGVVESGLTVDEILSDCFDRFQNAKATVQANMPAQYIPSGLVGGSAKPAQPAQQPQQPHGPAPNIQTEQ